MHVGKNHYSGFSLQMLLTSTTNLQAKKRVVNVNVNVLSSSDSGKRNFKKKARQAVSFGYHSKDLSRELGFSPEARKISCYLQNGSPI